MTIYKDRLNDLNNKKLIKENDYIIYWMQNAQRIKYNFGLKRAREMSKTFEKPIIVFFSLGSSFFIQNKRKLYFLLEGLLDIKEKLKDLNIKMIIDYSKVSKNLLDLANNSICLITDKGYLRVEKKLNLKVSKNVTCKVIIAESNLVVPVEIASQKQEYAAYTLRKKLLSKVDNYLKDFEPIKKQNLNLNLDFDFNINLNSKKDFKEISKKLKVENVIPSKLYKGGPEEAIKKLNHFIKNNLDKYEEFANDPVKDITSRLSPYLNYGHISPIYITKKILDLQKTFEHDFLEQIIVRRELAYNFIYFNKFYDKSLSKILPNWCQKTMDEHIDDKRKYDYSLDILENSKTHDVFWNACQNELKNTGLMHNYMRMYWGKKVLEWSDNYQNAFDNLVLLNDKYAIDGFSPNGYTGISWCFGKHDRAWKERDIFGKIRYMNANGLKRKFDIQKYVDKYRKEK
ncbi:MAG: deoxyribodipyrimidine photo-lyase [Bacillota bacterium]